MVDETTPQQPGDSQPTETPAAKKPARKPAAKKADAVVPPAAPVEADAPAEPVVPSAPAEPIAPVEAAPVTAVPAAVAPPAAEPVTPAEAPVASVPDFPPPAPAYAAVPAPRKRRIWPFVLGGGILVFLAVVITVAVIIVNLVTAVTPAKTVLNFDRAFEQADCELLLDSTTDAFQDSFFGGEVDCAAWVENAQALTVDGEYQYIVEVNGETISGDTAEVTTVETDSTSGDPVVYELVYHLVKDGSWRIDTIDDVSPQ